MEERADLSHDQQMIPMVFPLSVHLHPVVSFPVCRQQYPFWYLQPCWNCSAFAFEIAFASWLHACSVWPVLWTSAQRSPTASSRHPPTNCPSSPPSTHAAERPAGHPSGPAGPSCVVRTLLPAHARHLRPTTLVLMRSWQTGLYHQSPGYSSDSAAAAAAAAFAPSAPSWPRPSFGSVRHDLPPNRRRLDLLRQLHVEMQQRP